MVELTAELKVVIHNYLNQYLKGWLLMIGFANLIIVIGSLSYIFFILPKYAVSEATAFIEAEFRDQGKHLREITNQALVEAGGANAVSKLAGENAKQASDKVQEIKNNVETLSQDKVIAVSKAAKELSQNPNVAAVLNLSGRVSEIEKKPIWPDGHYCIFKSSSCPTGFTESRGGLSAIWMVQSIKGYVEESTFGDSSITHHGAKDRKPDSPDWHGQLVISTCCK